MIEEREVDLVVVGDDFSRCAEVGREHAAR